MKFAVSFALPVLNVLLCVSAVPTKPLNAVKKTLLGPVKPDSYIIVLKESVDTTSHLEALEQHNTRNVGSYAEITHEYTRDILNGYAATLSAASLEHVLSSGDVAYVEPNGLIVGDGVKYGDVESRDEEIRDTTTGDLAPRTSGGAGVDIYVIDTGIYTAHQCFGGRASWGATFGGYPSQDGNGHGTHAACVAIGTPYGIAQSAHAIAVKVLSDAGSGTVADVISGINYSANSFKASGRPSIALSCLGGSASSAVDLAVANAIAGGLHFIVVAGNSNTDASTTSPARVSGAITVGAIDASNVRASFSNYGSVLDIWATGIATTCAGITGPTSTIVLTGTCVAAAIVAGILAVVLGEYGQVTPATLSANLKSHALAVVTGVPAGTTNLKATLW